METKTFTKENFEGLIWICKNIISTSEENDNGDLSYSELSFLGESIKSFIKNPIVKNSGCIEKRVYLINMDLVENDFLFYSATDEQIKNIAEEQGTVYSLNGFKNVFNNDEINFFNSFIRII